MRFYALFFTFLPLIWYCPLVTEWWSTGRASRILCSHYYSDLSYKSKLTDSSKTSHDFSAALCSHVIDERTQRALWGTPCSKCVNFQQMWTLSSHECKTYRYENVEQVFQSWQLWDLLLDHFTESLKYRVIIYAGQIKAVKTIRRYFSWRSPQSSR